MARLSTGNFFSEKSNSRQQNKISQRPKLLCLKGQVGTVACQIHDPLAASLFPKRSQPWGRLKYAWLSEEKMHNLTAVRGQPGASMIGPIDYFYDLERPDKHVYTIEIESGGLPKINQYLRNDGNSYNLSTSGKSCEDYITCVDAKWFSGFDKHTISSKKAEYKEHSVFGENLFPNSGILEINGPKELKLQTFDPKEMDLSSFKARLVSNNLPFYITNERLHVDDEYCAVSYQYDADYADEQVAKGGGNFLEFHEFNQTITPLENNCSGFVTLGKWNKKHTQLELIAIQIPYGYTLIVEKNCIHGDTTLNGRFMMCMTSDHVSMATADTVFLKHTLSKDNIILTLNNPYDKIKNNYKKSTPFVLYDKNNDTDLVDFNNKTQGMTFIFTPTQGYWEIKKQTIITGGFLLSAGASLLITILLMPVAPIICITMLVISVLLASVGLFRVLKDLQTPIKNDLMSPSFIV